MSRFRVSRTSTWDTQPCPEAVRGTYTEHVYCTLRLDQAMRASTTAWFRALTNHRSAPDGSVADRENVPCWYIYLDGLDDLLTFVGRYGPCVVQRDSDGDSIEIYDDWRE